MTSADLKDLMLGAAVAVAGYMLWQHLKAQKQAQVEKQLDANVPQEIRAWDDPTSPVWGLGPELSQQMQVLLDEGLTMPIKIAGR